MILINLIGRKLIVALQCFIDESLDGFGNHTAVMAGYVAEEEVWEKFNADWNAELAKQKRPVASFGSGLFKGKRETKNAEAFYRIIEKHLDKAIVVTCSIPEYKGVLGRCVFPKSLQEAKYYKLFQREPQGMLYRAFMDLCYDERKKLGIFEPIDLIFDDTNKYKEWITNSFKYFYFSAKELGFDVKDFGREPVFKNDEKTPALQAADLLVCIVRHNLVEGNHETSMPWAKLKNVQHLISEMREGYMSQIFENSFSKLNTDIYRKYAKQNHYWFYDLLNRFLKCLPAFVRFPILRILNKPFLLG